MKQFLAGLVVGILLSAALFMMYRAVKPVAPPLLTTTAPPAVEIPGTNRHAPSRGALGTSGDKGSTRSKASSNGATEERGALGTTHPVTPPKGTVEERVRKIVAEQLGVDERKVTPDASFAKDLGADDLDGVELVMSFEEEFGVEISDGDAKKIITVKDAVDYIQKHVKER